MPALLSTTRALAVDFRDSGSGSLLAVALLVPSEKYASVLSNGAAAAVESKLTDQLWAEIEEWARVGDARLPARPAPLSRTVSDRLFERPVSPIDAERSASIPLPASTHEELESHAARILPELLATH